MNKKRIVIFCCGMVAVLLVFQYCGSSSEYKPDLEALEGLFPASGEVTDWMEDTAQGNQGVEVTDDPAVAAEELGFNGAINSFTATGGFGAVGEEYYQKDDITIMLNIIEMKDAQKASEAYGNMESSSVDKTDIDLEAGESQARISGILNYWSIEATKGRYYVYTIIRPRSDESSDDEGELFVKAVLNKIP